MLHRDSIPSPGSADNHRIDELLTVEQRRLARLGAQLRAARSQLRALEIVNRVRQALG